jgi:hypothetical protein
MNGITYQQSGARGNRADFRVAAREISLLVSAERLLYFEVRERLVDGSGDFLTRLRQAAWHWE